MASIQDVAKTLNSYFNTFAPAYLEGMVPNEAVYPYITYSYEYNTNFEPCFIQARIFTKGSSRIVKANEIADLINTDLGYGGKIVQSIWIKKGDPFFQNIPGDDITLGTIYLNLEYNN